MTVESKTEYLETLYKTPLDEIRGKHPFSKDVIKQFKKKVQLLMSVSMLQQLKQFRGLNFEYLKGNKRMECSIRLNDQFRLIFEQRGMDQIEIIVVNEISKHYE